MNDTGIVFDEVILKLKAAAKTNRTVDAAQVHIINLDDVIRRVGNHWPLVRDRIRAGSMDFLRGCVDPDDIIIPCGDGFLVIFAKGEQPDLAQRCSEIQDLLTAFYTGEEGLERLSAQVDGMSLEQGDLAHLISAPPPPPPPTPEASLVHGEHQIMFQPTWTAQAQLIACHFCTPTYCASGVMRYGYDAEYHRNARHGSEDYAALDAALLTVAPRELENLAAQGGRGVVGACVHASTMRNMRARSAYLARLRNVSATTLQRLVLRISEIEPNTPHSVLSEWVGQLRAYVRQVALQFHHSERALHRFAGTGAWSIGAQLPQHRRDVAGAPLKQLADLIGAWVRSARQDHLKLCVEDVRSAHVLHAGCAAGADFFTSDVFWPPRAGPVDAAEAPAPSLRDEPGASTLYVR